MATVTAMSNLSPWAMEALEKSGARITTVSGECDIQVFIENAWIEHHGPTTNQRPLIRLQGFLQSMTPYDADQFAFGVDTINFDPSMGRGLIGVDAYYELTDVQISNLAMKGFFTDKFSLPETLKGIVYTLPAHYELTAVGFEDENQAPMFSVNIENINQLVIDKESCGYDLEEYIPSVIEEGLEASATDFTAEKVNFTQYSEDMARDLISDLGVAQREVEVVGKEEESPLFDALLSEPPAEETVEDLIENERRTLRRGTRMVDQRDDYEEKIAPALKESMDEQIDRVRAAMKIAEKDTDTLSILDKDKARVVQDAAREIVPDDMEFGD